MAGDWGDDLAGVQRPQAQRRERNAGQFVKQARSRTREGIKARDPRARDRAAVVNSAGTAGLTWLLGIAMTAQP